MTSSCKNQMKIYFLIIKMKDALSLNQTWTKLKLMQIMAIPKRRYKEHKAILNNKNDSTFLLFLKNKTDIQTTLFLRLCFSDQAPDHQILLWWEWWSKSKSCPTGTNLPNPKVFQIMSFTITESIWGLCCLPLALPETRMPHQGCRLSLSTLITKLEQVLWSSLQYRRHWCSHHSNPQSIHPLKNAIQI